MSETLPLFSNGAAARAAPALSARAQAVLAVLREDRGPWTAAGIRKKWPGKPVPKVAEITAALEELKARGAAHRLPGARGAAAWSSLPLEAWLGEAEARVLEAVRSAPGPVPEKKLLAGAWPKALDAAPLRERLQEMQRTGRLKLWPGRTAAWWHLGPEEALGTVLLETLGQRAMPRAQWLREAKARLKGPGAAEWQRACEELIAAGRVLAHATKIDGKRVEACVRAERRAALLEIYRPVIERLKEEWRRLGIRDEDVARFLTGGGEPGAELLLEELQQLERESPPPNPVSLLRRRAALQGMSKQQFDHAALELMRQGLVYMAPHDHPMRLSEEERHALVTDGAGRYYVSITACH
ncbi:MAG: hypothetical protein WHT08_09590 [Bryobacteraceae bacterium]